MTLKRFVRRRLFLFALAPLFCCWTGLWAQPDGNYTIKVMTRNVDAGTDLGYIFGAPDLETLMAGATATLEEVQASGIPERAAGLADEIATHQPDLIALQEVTQWWTGPLGGPANTLLYDQLGLLLQELARRNLHYAPVVVHTLTDAEAPTSINLDVRMTDRDVILARTDRPDLTLANIQRQLYNTLFVAPTPLGDITVLRGWISVEATLRGRTFRFVNTHLESIYAGVPISRAIQVSQASELVQALNASALPTALLGDFNANAEPGKDHTHTVNLIRLAGFTDAWQVFNPRLPGYTWPLHGEDPYTPLSQPYERIDLIFARDLEILSVERIGARLSDRTPSGFWPSDHAGVVSTLRVWR